MVSGAARALMHRTCVITEGYGYPVAVYKVFVLSLLATRYSGDIKLLSPPNGTSPEALAFLMATRRVELVDIVHSAMHSSDRFTAYARLCRREFYAFCICADFRDVYFQADPFASILAHARAHGLDNTPELVLPLERRKIGGEASNRNAIQNCFSRSAFDAVTNRTVVCSGSDLRQPSPPSPR